MMFFFSGSCYTIHKFIQNPPSSVQRDFWVHNLNKILEMFLSVLVEGMYAFPFFFPLPQTANYEFIIIIIIGFVLVSPGSLFNSRPRVN